MRRALHFLTLGTALLMLPATSAMAMSFGRTVTATTLGQRLDFIAHVAVDADETLARECVGAEVLIGDNRVAPENVRVTLEAPARPRRAAGPRHDADHRRRTGGDGQRDRRLPIADVAALRRLRRPADAAAGERAGRRDARAAARRSAGCAVARDRSRRRFFPPARRRAEARPRRRRRPRDAPHRASPCAGPPLRRRAARARWRGSFRRGRQGAQLGAAGAEGRRPDLDRARRAAPAPGCNCALHGAGTHRRAGSVYEPGNSRGAQDGRPDRAGFARSGSGRGRGVGSGCLGERTRTLPRTRGRDGRLRNESQAQQKTLGALQARLRQAEEDRYANGLVYALAAAMIFFGLLAAAFWALRPRQRRRARWFDAHANQQRRAAATGHGRRRRRPRRRRPLRSASIRRSGGRARTASCR